MVKYIIKRLLNGLIVLLGVVTITFFITRVVPSDVAGKWAGERATEEQRKQAIAELGLDKPLVTQYVKYLKDLLSGDLGRSLRTKELITKELASYFPATMELVLVAFLFAMFVGIPMGIYSAKKNGQMLDHFTRFFSIGAVSLPTFWVAMVFQLVFYRLLNWLPLGGRMSISASLMYDVPNVYGYADTRLHSDRFMGSVGRCFCAYYYARLYYCTLSYRTRCTHDALCTA